MAEKLLPCPFCGREDPEEWTYAVEGYRTNFFFRCRYDAGGCGGESGYRKSLEEAVDAWNTRATDARAEAAEARALDQSMKLVAAEALADRLGEVAERAIRQLRKDMPGSMLVNDVAAALAEWRAARKGEPAPILPDRDALTKALVKSLLPDGFFCTRVWEAWNVGTMTKNDFEPIDCDQVADEILEALRALGKGEG